MSTNHVHITGAYSREAQVSAAAVAGSYISRGLYAVAKANQEGLKAVASSNKQIAQAIEKAAKLNARAILEAGYVIENGLQSIADEMRRKTYMEEHYLLLDRIDSLEDKIVSKGGNLDELYESLQTKYAAPITLSFAEILTMKNCLDKDGIKWLKTVVNTYKVNPWDVFINILEACKIAYRVYDRDEIEVLFYGELNYELPCCSGECFTLYRSDFDKVIHVYYSGQSKSADEFRERWEKSGGYRGFSVKTSPAVISGANAVKKKYDEKQVLSTSELEFINEFNAEINRINVEIMFENLRLIHTELRETYRQMKCK